MTTLLLLLLKLFLVTKPVLAFSIAGLVKGHVGGFPEELNIFGLALANNDWTLQVNVNKHNQLANTRLEEKVFDIAE